MAINPLSDIVLEVAMAADPARAQAAKQKLLEVGAAGADMFNDVLAQKAAAVGGEFSSRWSPMAEAKFFGAPTGSAVTGKGGMDEAKRGLETMIAKMMVETMLPKDGGTYFGKDNAGGIWRSMLADKLSAELTKGKGLGILRDTVLGKG
ncbi:MAG: rod-binding protein [Beijerinckiaceae bacterium]|nr:rod-binding protein [Beijerinckiaceae bacterium]MDO9440550.1 rod-binding protein [Beijerinckiaceae bacterium]